MDQKAKVIRILISAVVCLLLVANIAQAITQQEIEQIDKAVPAKATATAKQPRKLLVFNLCDGHKHKSIPYAAKALEAIAEKTAAFEVTQSEDMAIFKPENINQFDAIVFNNTTKLKFDDPVLRQSLMDFVKNGKGIVGIHAATDCFYTWPEAAEMIGGMFDGHPWNKGGTWAIKIDDPNHPVTAAFKGQGFKINDEIYRIKEPYSRSKLRVLVSLDMDDKTNLSVKNLKLTDVDIPVSWVQSFGKGRVFYCSLGHNPDVFWNPAILQHYLDGIQFALGDLPADTTTSLDNVLAQIAVYEYGQSRKPLTELTDYIRDISGQPRDLKQLEKSLIQLLQSDATMAAKQFACRQLSIIGTEDSVPALAAMLTDVETSDMARYALERIPAGTVDDALRAALPNTSGKVKIGIINSLGIRRDIESVEIMAEQIYQNDTQVASAAVSALGQIADFQAMKFLDQARYQTTGNLRLLVLDAYLKCIDMLAAQGHKYSAKIMYAELHNSNEPSSIRIAALSGAVRVMGHGAVNTVVNYLKGDDSAMQVAAIGLIRDVPGTKIIEAVSAELANLAPERQIQVLSALGDRRDKAALGAVVAATKNDDQSVRIAALKALAQVGDASIVVQLAQTAAQTTGPEQEAARQSLYRVPSTEVDQVIDTSIAQAESKVKVELIRAVSQRNAIASVPTLLASAKDSDIKVRIESLKALKTVAGPQHVPALLDILISVQAESERKEAEKTIAAVARKITDPSQRAEPILAVLPDANDVKVRGSLMQVLGKIGDVTAFPVLRKALQDSDPQIQVAAIRALSAWPNAEPANDLMQVARSSENQTHQILALRGLVQLLGLGSISADETIKMYKQAMELAPNVSEKKMVLSGLAKMSGLAALEMAADYLDDQALQLEAEAAVVKIAGSTRKRKPQETKAILLKVLEVSTNESVREQAQKILDRIKQ